MNGPARPGSQGATDLACSWPVTDSQTLADGPVFTTVRETVTTPSGESMTRDYIKHKGSVVILAADAEDRLVLIEQYRHPVRHRVVEAPAGLLDQAGEPPLLAAQRELAEEVGLTAENWSLLVELFASPGCSDECTVVYLATGLSPTAAPEGFVAADEEADMVILEVSLDEVVAQILAGRLHNPGLVAGALALHARRAGEAGRDQASA